jgi:hypothetical protein
MHSFHLQKAGLIIANKKPLPASRQRLWCGVVVLVLIPEGGCENGKEFRAALYRSINTIYIPSSIPG